MLSFRNAACAMTMSVLSAASSAQYVPPYGALGLPGYDYGCSGIYLGLARHNDDLARIRARLRRLELETDQSVRATQWNSALEAENRNLRQQNALFQQRVLELEAKLGERNARNAPEAGR